jgi:hypothetical protein
MALTTNVPLERKEDDLFSIPLAATQVVKKGMNICRFTGGNAYLGDDTASHLFAGIAEDEVNSTGFAAEVRVRRNTIVKRKLSGTFAQTDVGSKGYVKDNELVALVAGITNNVEFGIFLGLADGGTTHGWFDINGYCK